MELLMAGHTRTDCLVLGEEWKVSDRTIDEYISKAHDRIAELVKQESSQTLGIILKNLWDIHRDAKMDNNLREARQALNDIAKLKGLQQQTINHVVSPAPQRLDNLTDSELDSILDAEFEVKEDNEDES